MDASALEVFIRTNYRVIIDFFTVLLKAIEQRDIFLFYLSFLSVVYRNYDCYQL